MSEKPNVSAKPLGGETRVTIQFPQEIADAVKYFAAACYDAGKHGAAESSSVTDASNELGHAIGLELAAKDRELAELLALVDELPTYLPENDPDGFHQAWWRDLISRARALRSSRT